MKDLQVKLQELGLSGREAEIYLALLMKKELTAPEVAKITSVTRTKSYELLQNLVKKRVCNERYKNGTKVFSSIEPTIAIQNILSVYEDELNRKKNLAEQFREDLVELHKNKEENNSPLDYIEVLTDVGQIRERWQNILRNTKRELLVFTKPPYTSPSVSDSMEMVDKILKRKVTIKSIYEYNSLKNSEEINELINTIEAYQKVGEESRIIKNLPMKLVISDETVTMFALNDRVSLLPSITTMIVDHPSFANALKMVFQGYWVSGILIEDFKSNLNKYIK